MRKILLSILFILLVVAFFYKSPFSAMYNCDNGKKAYTTKQYDKAIQYFERSLIANPRNSDARYYYALTLTKSKPTYSVQKKLYELANSEIHDQAQKYAKSQTISLRRKLLEGVENNYVANATMGNDIVRWDIKSFPLSVYVEKAQSVPEYYIDSIEKALKVWERRTNFISFKMTNDKNVANIVIDFKEYSTENCNNEQCIYTAAYTEPSIDNSNKTLKRMNLTFYKTNPNNQNFSPYEIFNTALHESGHTLGIIGHSENPDDVMYAQKDNSFIAGYRSSYNSVSMRDVKTLALLYRLKPTISNKKDLSNENFYYAPLIIGSDDSRLQTKINEYKRYIEKYPNIVSGYINLASAYADAGEFDNASKVLSNARKLSPTQDEMYIIYYNYAVIYFNKQEYLKALDYAKQAQSIKQDSELESFINEINEMLNR